MNDNLIWKVCQSINDSIDKCKKCPAEVNTPYGKGVHACRLHAEEVINLIRQHVTGEKP